jgi:hypothetical protein
MDLVILGIIILIVTFGVVVFVGPPFVPTLNKQVLTALDMLDLKPGQTLLELGSGDGRVAKAAAERGLKVVGIELNPFLIVIARIRCWHYRSQVMFIWDDMWKARWPEADGIFTFLIQRQMERLDKRIAVWRTGPVKLASFAFFIPGKPPVSKFNGVFLYEYGGSSKPKRTRNLRQNKN